MSHDRQTAYMSVLIGLGLGMVLVCLLQFYFAQSAQQQAAQEVSQKIERQLSVDLTAITAQKLNQVIQLEKDTQGRVTAVLTDTAQMNQLQHQIISEIYTCIETMDFSELAIPMRNARFLKAPITQVAVTHAQAYFQNQFEESGINQTRHCTVLCMEVQVDIHMPTFATSTQITLESAVFETLIIGAVPYEYHQGT